MINKQEQEIMKNWILTNESLVSIFCITYNHEKYIAEALDSFLMQETDFSFEILIHDDASTDNTAKIIRSYENKYPSLIKPIYQTENQYSKGIEIHSTFNLPRAKGEYIALCEGDDFWTDERKLQYQIKKMKEYPECQMSFHPVKVIYNQRISDTVQGRQAEDDKIFDIKEIIMGNGGFCPTPSLIIKKEVFDNIPAFFENAPVGDYYIQIFGSINGGALYIDKTMSAYRIHSGGVWTSMQTDFSSRKKFAFKFLQSLEQMDGFFNYQHKDEIAFIKSQTFSDILGNKNFSIRDRVDLYKICIHHISDNDQTKWLDDLVKKFEQQNKTIKDKDKTIETQNSTIKDKASLLQKTSQRANQIASKEKTITGAIQNMIQYPILKHPVKKYKAYKKMLKIYYQVKASNEISETS